MRTFQYFFSGLLLFLVVNVVPIFAQEIKLTGVLFENGTKVRVALAEITNKRSGYSVGSNDLGLFYMKAVVGDTLLITKRGFVDMQVAVTSAKDLILRLNRGNLLDEVTITRQSKKQALNDMEKDFKAKGTFYAGKPPLALLSPFGGSPLTFFYELFGKTPRDARRFRKYHATELEQSHVDEFFNKTIINKNTGLEGKALDDFLISYRPDYEIAKNWTSYDGLKWIADSYKKYTGNLKSPL